MKPAGVGLAAVFAASYVCFWVSAAAAPNNAASEATIAARQHFFGAENVDATNGKVRGDRVIFSWITNAGYAVSFRGRVVLLDTYINRFEVAPASGPDLRRTPFGAQDLIDLHPEAIFLGHGHGDHADNAAYISKWLNIPIYSTPETCDVMQQDLARMAADPNTVNGGAKLVPNANPVNCIGVVPRGSVPGTAVVNIKGCKHQAAQSGGLHRRLQAHSLRYRSD
jgi:glyoxylase-like metal-dependent hydrolase (beta-lactamase superfamily II)